MKFILELTNNQINKKRKYIINLSTKEYISKKEIKDLLKLIVFSFNKGSEFNNDDSYSFIKFEDLTISEKLHILEEILKNNFYDEFNIYPFETKKTEEKVEEDYTI